MVIHNTFYHPEFDQVERLPEDPEESNLEIRISFGLVAEPDHRADYLRQEFDEKYFLSEDDLQRMELEEMAAELLDSQERIP